MPCVPVVTITLSLGVFLSLSLVPSLPVSPFRSLSNLCVVVGAGADRPRDGI